jgi:GTP 3',8-cyclase
LPPNELTDAKPENRGSDVSLVDGFGRRHAYLRISVTDRCDLRCIYCMPRMGVAWRPRSEILSLEEILRVARVAISLGIEKIRLTGGEPLVRHNIEGLISELATLPGLQTLAMTTNGTSLAWRARELRQAGLQAINISLDTLRRERFREIALQDRLHDVLAGIEAALDAGFARVKVNVVIMAGINDDELPEFVEFARMRPLNLRFIEFMPFPGTDWHERRFLPWRDMLRVIQARTPLQPLNGHALNGTTHDFLIPHGQGTISFISPLSEEFCDRCNRLRLTADGAVKSCLLFPAEVNLRETLRDSADDETIAVLLRAALAYKNFVHPPLCHLPQLANRCMTATGG